MGSTGNRSVSIVINTLNRAHLLGRTLHSFAFLDYDPFEVIVVNGPSTDGTQELLEQHRDRIKIGRCPEANLAKSRNIGIAMAAGEFVAFIDDDALPEPEWLWQAIEGFDSDDVAATGGKVFDHTGYDYQYQYSTSNRLGNGKWKLTEPSPECCFPYSFEFPYLQGTNTIFRKRHLLEVGGFDEEFAYYLDETEVCLRLVDAGYIVRQLDKAYVHHKYASSHIRHKGVARYRFPVLKSKIYYSNRYAPGYVSQADIEEDNRRFIEEQRRDVLHHVNEGNLTEADRLQFEEHVRQATLEGKAAAKAPQKLITPELLTRHATPFKPFPRLRCDGRRLTIVLLCEDYPPALLGGIARITQAKATGLAALGHNVHVIARSHDRNTVDFEDGVWVHRITADYQPLSDRAAALGIPQSHWDQSQSFLNEINRIATHRPIDVVETPVWNIVGIAALLSGHYRIVTSLQTTLKLSLQDRPDLLADKQALENFVKPMIRLEQYLIESSHMVKANSRVIVEQIESCYEMKINPRMLRLVYHGMPDWAASTPPETETMTARKPGAIHLLFVGRLEKRKGIDTLLEAAPRLLREFPELEIDIVGDDSIIIDGRNTYRQLFEAKHGPDIRARVHFHQKVSEERLRSFYASCDIFVAPSRFESFGLIYLEAMMFAKPVVGCRAGGAQEVIVHEETGMLASPADAQSLYCAIAPLVRDRALRERLGVAGRRRFEQVFSLSRMAEASVAAYRELVDAQTGSSAEEQPTAVAAG
jgi:hypothetical protein